MELLMALFAPEIVMAGALAYIFVTVRDELKARKEERERRLKSIAIARKHREILRQITEQQRHVAIINAEIGGKD